jgi:hypothetical protein
LVAGRTVAPDPELVKVDELLAFIGPMADIFATPVRGNSRARSG